MARLRPEFHAHDKYLKQILMTDFSQDVPVPIFTLNGNALDHVTKLVECMKCSCISLKIGNVINTDQHKTITYNGVTCFQAAQMIAEAFETDWWCCSEEFNLTKYYDNPENFTMTFRGNVAPESNVPFLICGGEVNIAGELILSCGSDSFAQKSSTGHYIITLPDYMRGNENYIVELTPVMSDNRVTRAGIDTKANCFWVQTWQSPGQFEDSGFTFMVHGSGPRLD